uniref:Reverse transcriptase zinc-binding domain-containing protein n=1 Tax=Fagus sylvatica TaxID=28930 RepID=A0A2N9HL96_FAGSY
MGFRELREFNDALLGKQVWRLLTDTNSLLYRVFKAKFFPHCSILEAEPKTKGSYAWQSILKARDFTKNGTVWRVGDGKNIKIWKQRWLLEDHHRQVITPTPTILADSTVSELISPITKQWDETLIDSIFLPYDAIAIKSIPLSEGSLKDKPFWPGTTTGQYTVRSGYKFLQAENLKLQPSCSNSKPMEQSGRSVVPASPQKNSSVYMACSKRLPSIQTQPEEETCGRRSSCEMCAAPTEDILHALWECPQAKSAWNGVSGLRDARKSKFLNLQTFGAK